MATPISQLPPAQVVGWNADTGLGRAAAGVVSCNNDAGGLGWLQNSAGMCRVTASVTNTSTTFTAVGDLTDTLIAGRKYVGRMAVKCNNTVAGEGIKFDFAGGSATMTSFWSAVSVFAAGGAAPTAGTVIGTALNTALNFTSLGSTSEYVLLFLLSIVVNAAGTFIPRFAENSTSSGTASFELGSYLDLWDVRN